VTSDECFASDVHWGLALAVFKLSLGHNVLTDLTQIGVKEEWE
jgi:hypothetical protein